MHLPSVYLYFAAICTVSALAKTDFTFFNKFYVTVDTYQNVTSAEWYIRYVVDMPYDTYIGFVYGQDMRAGGDIFAFLGDRQHPKVLDLFARGTIEPPNDRTYNYNLSSFAPSKRGANRLTITTARQFNTSDDADYVIVNGTTINMATVYADTSYLSPHGSSVQFFQLSINTNEQVDSQFIVTDSSYVKPYNYTHLHAWLMWAGWGLLGLAQAMSNRYFKKYWRQYLWVHRICGSLILAITISMGLLGISKSNWSLNSSEPHNVIGLIIFFSTFFVAVGGVFARSMTRRLKWRSALVHRIQTVHKMAGRSLLILAQVAILLGVQKYNEQYYTVAQGDSLLGQVHIVIYFSILVLIECGYQLFKLLKLREFQTKDKPKMTLEEFEFKVHIEGFNLVLLDNLVLDVGAYMDNHPGGKFLIEHNVGRDISKFFYGGYGLDGNLTKTAYLNAHSNIARLQVDTLIVAVLHSQNSSIENSLPIQIASVTKREKFNSITQTITLNIDQEACKGVSKLSGTQKHYKGLSMIGKHFLINECGRHTVKRQYTVANCLDSEYYGEYLEALRDPKNAKLDFTYDEAASEFSITVKNYKKREGLSMRLAEADLGTTFEVQGPMGKGLGIQREGTHVAFTAGTGCLVFLDLVAHLIRKNLGLLDADEDGQLGPSFRFVFFMSFPKREEAIGLELCTGLSELCQKKGIKNFELVTRFSIENKERWDSNFIDKTLAPLNPKRVWVCGTPALNEAFDRHLSATKRPYSYEIM